MEFIGALVQLDEQQSRAVYEFMRQMDREHKPTNLFPVSAQERLYWSLGGPQWRAPKAARADA